MRHRIIACSLALAALLGVLGVPAAAAVEEPAGSCASGATLASGSTARDRVGGTDADWYRFSLATRRTVVLTLGGLGADARLVLVRGCGKAIASSDRRGSGYEELVARLEPGDYGVRVDTDGAADATSYALRLRSFGGAPVVLSHRAWIEGPNLRVVGEVFNPSRATLAAVRVRFIFYDREGRVIAPIDTERSAIRPRIGPLERSLFVLDYAGVPAGYGSVEVVVESARRTPATAATPLVSVAESSWVDGSGTRHYTGRVVNANDFAVRAPRVSVTAYDDRGRVLNGDVLRTRRSDAGALAPGASDPFGLDLWSQWRGADRVVFVADGERVVPAATAPRPGAGRSRSE